MAAAPSLGVATLPELIALAKQRPGQISYAVTGIGRLTHLTGELLQLRAGIKLLLVPYSGGPSHALNDIMGGRIPLIIEGYSGLAGAIQGGNLKPLAVAGVALAAVAGFFHWITAGPNEVQPEDDIAAAKLIREQAGETRERAI